MVSVPSLVVIGVACIDLHTAEPSNLTLIQTVHHVDERYLLAYEFSDIVISIVSFSVASVGITHATLITGGVKSF